MPSDVRIVTETFAAPADEVYRFASREANLPQWASGLAAGIRHEGGRWLARSPMGIVTVAMAPPNAHGVLDHDVTLPDGKTTHNAFRVTPAGAGSVATFVLVRPEGMTPEAFEADAAHVARDLKALKHLVERLAP